MPEQPPILDPILQQLAEYIDKNGGVLFIGPALSRYRDSDDLILEKFSKQIQQDFGLLVPKEAKESSLNYVLQDALRSPERVERLASIKQRYKVFFEKHFRRKHLYHLIAQVNFRLIINTNPDEEIFNELDGPKVFSFFDCSNNGEAKVAQQPAGDAEGTVQNANLDDYSFDKVRAVYNIFGSFRSPNSVRLCESDFIDLIKEIARENRIPAVVKNYIASKVPLVFIGFSYNDWYLKVLFKVLDLGNARELTPRAISNPMSIHSNPWPEPGGVTRLFYEGEFNFMFRNHLTEDYIETLVFYMSKTKEKAADNTIRPLRTVIIFNYESPEDKKLKDRFLKQLNFLKGKYIADLWTLDSPDSGQVRKDEAEIKTSQAEVAIFLLSPDFHANPTCVEYLEDLSKQKNIVIVPILIRDYLYGAIPVLQDLDILPVVDGEVRPLAGLKGNFDKVTVEICETIQVKIKERRV